MHARSQLLKWTAFSDDTLTGIEAQFLIDRLDGDAEANPDLNDSCVVISQRYEFYREGLVPLEPFGLFPSAKFRPIVKYAYFTDPGGPALKALTTAQRLHFDIRNSKNPTEKASANDTMLSCDVDPALSQGPCKPSVLNLSVLGMFHNQNPLQNEQLVRIIEGGHNKVLPDPLSLVFKGSTTLDNFHQNPTPADVADQDHEIDEPTLFRFGCPACMHIHWRWSSVFDPGVTSAIIGVDQDFNNNKGNLFLPPGSDQDVDLAILKSGGPEEQHPASVASLFDPELSILPSVLGETQTPVVWYIATGHRNSDQFFLHAGGLGTFYVDSITVPTPSNIAGQIVVHVEHSRDLDYNITVKNRLDAVFHGHLPVGKDDIILQVPGGTTNPAMDIELIDNSLVPPSTRNRFFRTFDNLNAGKTQL